MRGTKHDALADLFLNYLLEKETQDRFLAKSMIFMPMAISFVGASVIWKLIYDTREAGQPQIGLLNALWMQAQGGVFSILILQVLPAALLMMTCFTRIIIVLAILRQALGLGQSPPNQLLVGMALLLTVFVMKPSLDRIYDTAYQPMVAGSVGAVARPRCAKASHSRPRSTSADTRSRTAAWRWASIWSSGSRPRAAVSTGS